MKDENKTHRGFVTALPSHPLKRKPRCLFTGTDQTGKEVSIEFIPLSVPGMVTPDEFSADVKASGGALPGTLTLFAPQFDLGKFRYRRPGSNTDTETDATDARSFSPEMTRSPAPPATPAPAPAKTPEPPTREPSRGMDIDF